jgi:hypothetical protein
MERLQREWLLLQSVASTWQWRLIFWAILIPSVHISLLMLFRSLNLYPQISRKRSRGSDLIAVEITSTLCVIWFSIIGTIGYFNLFGFTDGIDLQHHQHEKTETDMDTPAASAAADLFYGYSSLVNDHLITPMYAYQVWNFIVCFLHNEYQDFAAMAHHLVTACLASCGFHPFAHYYALFYFGIAELTTIPLNIINTFKHVPRLAESYPSFYHHTRTIFALSFLLIRLLWWPVVSYGLFFACLDLLQSEKLHSIQIVCFFLFSNLFLSGLQFYWGYLIVKNALKGKTSNKKKKKEEEVITIGIEFGGIGAGTGGGTTGVKDGGKLRHKLYPASLR